MMIVFGNFAQFAQIQKAGELVKMKHRVVLTMLAKIRHVLAEIHILQMIRNITAVTALHAFAEFLDYFLLIIGHIAIVSETKKKCKFSERIIRA
jgi:uncharacterized membrane protein